MTTFNKLHNTVGGYGSRATGILLGTVLFVSNASGGDLLVDRRKDQFPTTSGRLLAPLPYSMPGLGEGFFLLGHFANMFASTTDLTLLQATGDVKGTDLNLDQIPLIEKHLYVHAELLNLSSIQQNYYDARGMNTGKDDYTLLDITSLKQRRFGLDLTFFERRVTLSVDRSHANGELDTVRDPEGIAIQEFADPYKFKNNDTRWGLQLDFTDDYQDARKGVRTNLRYQNRPALSGNDPDYFVTELDATVFTPMFTTDTLVFNIFQSDAHVRKKGNTDRTAIAQELGFECDSGDTQCQATEAAVIDNFVNERAHGTATSLGGVNRLRAFPGERFNGAHVASIGAEYRMNFVRDATPFNFSVWRDTHTGIQLAFFSEFGSVAETMNELWQDSRFVYGSGIRLVTGSGAVYRFDLAVGDEGLQPNLFFYYPWN